MPTCEATAPSSLTAAPDPLATASARRRSANSAWPALRSRESISCTAASGKAGDGERWTERVLDDRPCGAERVGADAEDDRVAAADHAARIGEHVRPALEHEAHDPERRPPEFDRPTVVLHRPHDLRPPRLLVAPDQQTGHHVAPHGVGECESGRRPLRARGPPRRRRGWPRRSARTLRSSASRRANSSKNAEIARSSHRARSANAPVAASTACVDQ